jgi:predicted O-methyltransferase YrrM
MNSYNDVFGWFDFQEIYDEAISEAKDGDKFLEIGCYMGKSTSYLLQKIKDSGKKIDVYVIDLFDTSSIFQSEQYPSLNGRNLEDIFDENMKTLDLHPIKVKGNSKDLFDKFENDFFSMIFIDGSHDYSSVKNDMVFYYPKLKEGGIFAGHDFNEQNNYGVVQAVNYFSHLKNIPYQIKTTSWYFRNPKKLND